MTYGNSTLTLAGASASSTSGATYGNIGLMYSGSVADGESYTYTFSGFSITYTSTSSSDDDDDTGDTGDTTDYTFPIEGVAMGNTGSATYDSTTGTITFTSGTWTSSGWWFGFGSTVKLDSLTITFAEATSHYMNVAVEYADSTTSTSVAINSGSTSVTVTPEDAYIKQIYIADSNSNGGTLKIADVTYTVASDEEETTPTFSSRTLSLGGKIGVNFYVDFGDIDVSTTDYHVVFTVDNTETEAYVSNATAMGDGIYVFTCEVPCWEMGTTITAVITDGADDVDTMTYSVSKYATNMNGYSDALDNLLNAMLVYGNYASAYKNDGTTVSGVTDKTSTVTDLSDYASELLNGDEITGATAEVILDETCELKFTLSDNSYVMYIDDVQTTSITGILVQNWDYEFDVLINDADGECVCEFTYSVLTYVNTVISDTTGKYTDAHVNLVKAMYLYNVAADAYNG